MSCCGFAEATGINIINEELTLTSNQLYTDLYDEILINSNINSNYTSNSSNILSNLIKIEVDQRSNLIYKDSNLDTIVKLTAQNPFYPVGEQNFLKFYTAENECKTRINQEGQLEVYHPLQPIPVGYPAGWWNVEDKLSSMIQEDINARLDITNLQLSSGVNTITNETEATAAAIASGVGLVGLSGATGAVGGAVAGGDYSSVALGTGAGVLFSVLSYLSYQAQVGSNLSNLGFSNQFSNVNCNMSNANLLLASNLYSISRANGFINCNILSQQFVNDLKVSSLNLNGGNITNLNTINGITGIFGSISTTNNTNEAIPSTSFFGGIGDKIIIKTGTPTTYPSSIGIENNALWISSQDNINFYNRGIKSLSLTSNNSTQIFGELLCNSNIKLNEINISNIFVASNVLSNTSNTLYNLTFNSSNNNSNFTFNSSNNNSNLIFNSSNILSNNIFNSSNNNSNFTFNSSNILLNNILNFSNNNSNLTSNSSNILSNNIFISSNSNYNFTFKELYNENYTNIREYPPKLYNSSSSPSLTNYLGQNNIIYENITLNTDNITYGNGIYEIYSSTYDDNNISFTGGSLNNVIGNNDYSYILFINNGTLTLNSPIICDIFMIGGGGGGGYNHGSGGGAGAYFYGTNITLNSGTYNINIGSGGAGGTQPTAPASGGDSFINYNGNDLIINSLNARCKGGGGGGYYTTAIGVAGGCGGGADGWNGNLSTNTTYAGGGTNNSGTIGTGFAGGSARQNYASQELSAGGGGGIGSVGQNASGKEGGDGGNGLVINITGSENVYGGGGGGGEWPTYATSPAGRGGGATLSNGTFVKVGGDASRIEGGNGGDAIINTGSGGGGGKAGRGGNGSAGIIIIRFLKYTSKKELFDKITNDNGCSFKNLQYNNTTGYYNLTNNYIINGYFGDWLIIKLRNPIILTSFKIWGRTGFINRAPGLWRFYGSIDGINYELIPNASNETNTILPSSYIDNVYEKLVNDNNKFYLYYGIVVNRLSGITSTSTALNFTELELFGKEFINYIPIYTSSNVVKYLVRNEMPDVGKRSAIIVFIPNTATYYDNVSSTTYYKYDLDLRQYTKTQTIVSDPPTNDLMRIFKIRFFYTPAYFGSYINSQPYVSSYEVYMSYKNNPIFNRPETQGLNIYSVGFPNNTKLENILPNQLMLLRNVSGSINYLTIVSRTAPANVSVIIEDMLF